MNERQNRLIRAAQSAVPFVASLQDPPLRVTQASKRLEQSLRDAREAWVAQIHAMNLRREPQISLSRAKKILLRQHLGPIIADGLEMFVGFPGIKETLRAPRIKDPPEKLLEAAERVWRFAEAHKQEFIDEGDYSPDFLEQFDLAIQNLDAAARADKGAARARYTQSTREVKDEIARVRRALDVLDARMHEAYLDDREKLKDWRHASRIPARLGRPKKRKPRFKGADSIEGAAQVTPDVTPS
jgi:hypothetical protein